MVTYLGTEFDDRFIVGDSGEDDDVYLYDGNDYFDYLGGEPHLYVEAGEGDDSVRGGSAGDLLLGEDGRDVLYGEDGDDTILGGNGDDMSGIDTPDLIGGRGNDWIDGGDGDDAILGDIFVSGVGGNDTLLGGEGRDTIYGDGGDDSIFGGAGVDFMGGFDGDDYIEDHEGLGNTFNGGPGNDTLIGHGTTSYGGEGNDWIEAISNGAPFYLQIAAGSGNDTISVTNEASGTAVSGDEGDDLIVFIVGSPLANMADGNDGNDTIYGSNYYDQLSGGRGSDFIWAGSGNDRLYGDLDASSEDTMFGGDGDDDFFGSLSPTLFDAGSGNDTITSGLVDEVFVGGEGLDLFYYELLFGEAPQGHDRIVDFTPGSDRVMLSHSGLTFETVLERMVEEEGAAVFHYNFQNIITFEGVRIVDFTARDFEFNH